MKNKVHYSYGLIFPFLFSKHWVWFKEPADIKGAAMVNYFSYSKREVKGFYRTEGLTTIINLEQDLEIISSKMRKKFIKKQIGRGKKRGIAIRCDNNFKEYKGIYKEFRKKKHLFREKFRLFKENGILFSAYYENKMIAGGVFIGDGESIRAWVLSSLRQTSDSKMREMTGQANRMIMLEAIKYAISNGYKLFDLGGIDPDSKDKAQRTLAEYKEAFGGERKKCYYYYKVYSPILKIWMRIRGMKNV